MSTLQKLTSEEKYGLPPDSVETFIKLLRTRNDKLQEDLADAEDTVWSVSQRKQATVVSGNLEDDEINITSDVKKKVNIKLTFPYNKPWLNINL